MNKFSTMVGDLKICHVNFLEHYIERITNGDLGWFTYIDNCYVYDRKTGDFVDVNSYTDEESQLYIHVEQFLNCGCEEVHRFDLVDQVDQLQTTFMKKLYHNYRFNR